MRNPLNSIAKRLTRLKRFPALGRRDGAPFVLDPRNWIDNRLLSGVRYENLQLDFARRQIAERGIDLVVDIGANFGLYSILLGREPGVREVIAFEPVRRNYNQLLGNVFVNRLDGKVTAHRLGLGDKAASLTIHIDPTSTGVSRLDLSSTERDTSVFTESETVEIRTFDSVCAPKGRAAFVKIDVEGHAPAVVSGMAKFLAANRGVLQVEVMPTEIAVIEALADHGWREIASVELDHYFAKD